MQLIDFSIIHAIVIFFNPPSYFIQDDESVPDRDQVSVFCWCKAIKCRLSTNNPNLMHPVCVISGYKTKIQAVTPTWLCW